MDRKEIIDHELEVLTTLIELTNDDHYAILEDCVSVVATYIEELYAENRKLKEKVKEN